MDMVRILIVDDHPIVREGLRTMLNRESDFDVCGDVGTSAEAMELVRLHHHHLAVVDVLLHEENGLDLIQRIHRRHRKVRSLAWSMCDDQLYAERALAAGSRGYLNKRAGIGQMIEAIRFVISGGIFLCENIKQRILSRSMSNGPVPATTPIENLSDRQLEVFRLIGLGLTPSQIAERLRLNVKTIDTYRRRINELLRFDSSATLMREASQWVLKNGS